MAKKEKDGAYAWLVAGSVYTILFIHGGVVYSVGVIFILLHQHFDATGTQLTLVTSLNVALIYGVGPCVGLLTNRFCERSVSMVGAGMASAGMVLSFFSTQVIHLYLTYGILCGAGLGMVYNSALTMLNKYFDKWKLVAMGLSISGIGLGSFAFPPMINFFEEVFGWRGAFIMLGGVNLHTLISCALLKPLEDSQQPQIANGHINKEHAIDNGIPPKLPTTTEKTPSPDKHLDRTHVPYGSAMKITDSNIFYELNNTNKRTCCSSLIKYLTDLSDRRYVCLCLYSLVKYFPIMILYTYFGTFVISIGYKEIDSTKFYMTMGISDMLSRPLVGIGTKLTGMNEHVICGSSAIANGILAAMLPFLRDRILLYIFAALSGLFLCTFNVLCVAMVSDSIPASAVATGFGLSCMICVPGTLFGAPLAAIIYEYTSIYSYLFYLTAALFVLSGLLLFPAFPIFNRKKVEETAIESTIYISCPEGL